VRLNPRILTVAVHDVFMAVLSFELSVAIRYATYGAPQSPFFLWQGTLVFAAVCALTFWRTGLYRGIWYYASLNDLIAIVKAVTLAILVFLPAMFLITRLENFPRTALVINWPLLVLLLAGPRFLYRALKDGDLRTAFRRYDSDPTRVPVLLAGAGDAAETFIREMGRTPNAAYRVIGIIDDKPGRIGRDIRGVRVMGALADIDHVVTSLKARIRRPQRVIIASEHYDGAQLRALLDACERHGMTLARLPRLTDFRGETGTDGNAPPDAVHPVDVADLLGRPQRVLDRAAMRALIAGRRVLITGAGGTIGGELVRQIGAFGPARIVLLDNAEFNLYRIDREAGETYPELQRRAVLADVRDPRRIAAVFAEESPELVFHAAAFKHVPMVETNPAEGILTNVGGTRVVADACRDTGTRAMVLISTDKAVEPSSVMGATKRIAETYCRALDRRRTAGGTRYVAVRFGNVLGSTGSVVPLFEHQIAAGGPVTVTDPDVTRYFMTTREAVELVLQASALGDGDRHGQGQVYVLDMGEPVLIRDLARQMIRLAGKRPEQDVSIVFTGLRPGEKLHEKLFDDDELVAPTSHEAIRLAGSPTPDPQALVEAVDRLVAAARGGDRTELCAAMAALVPGFVPAGTAGPEGDAASI
jgi:FlaA1/EpsC-like NDP-sugar epimerase